MIRRFSVGWHPLWADREQKNKDINKHLKFESGVDAASRISGVFLFAYDD